MPNYVGNADGALVDMITTGTGSVSDQVKVVEMENIIYRLDSGQNPFLVFLNMLPKKTTFNEKYDWNMKEGFDRRTFKGTFRVAESIVTDEDAIGVQIRPKDWNAIAYMAGVLATHESVPDRQVRLEITNDDGSKVGGTAQFTITGYLKREAYVGLQQENRAMVGTDGTEDSTTYNNLLQITKNLLDYEAAASQADLIIDSSLTSYQDIDADPVNESDISDGDDAFIRLVTPNLHQKGYPQGSGLGSEMHKGVRHDYNYTQIFKDPITVSDTLANSRLIGGSKRDEKHFEVGKSHASDIEYSLLFQGGGVEGVGGDWGILEATENPRTAFKGFGVGHESGKPGFIVTHDGTPWASSPKDYCQMDLDSAANIESAFDQLLFNIFDDTSNSGNNKLLLGSIWWEYALTKLAKADGTAYRINMDMPYKGVVGAHVQRYTCPFGDIHCVRHPMFNGRFQRLGLIVDISNVRLRPFNNRDTKLHLDVSSGEIDGITDEYRTEIGIEIRFEHTMALPYISTLPSF